uniref:Uncharacterized protein n=1 Tax=Abalone asfa-like virus TaxID=2839893 RepID=A0A5K7XZA4_9VIRU|nr:hypothetical protein [Abalone asfa-like virus]BCY04592.1 hypothetical protein [Abalone asfa-like virus]
MALDRARKFITTHYTLENKIITDLLFYDPIYREYTNITCGFVKNNDYIHGNKIKIRNKCVRLAEISPYFAKNVYKLFEPGEMIIKDFEKKADRIVKYILQECQKVLTFSMKSKKEQYIRFNELIDIYHQRLDKPRFLRRFQLKSWDFLKL